MKAQSYGEIILAVLVILWGFRGWWCYTKLRDKYRTLYNICERMRIEHGLFKDAINRRVKIKLPLAAILWGIVLVSFVFSWWYEFTGSNKRK